VFYGRTAYLWIHSGLFTKHVFVKLSLRFQKVFDQQVKQDDIFDHVAQGVVDK